MPSAPAAPLAPEAALPASRTPPSDLIALAAVPPAQVEWLWQDRIPLGAITLLDGDPGTRKSTLSLNIAACVSTGRALPGSSMPPISGGVLLLGEEDGLGDTVRPRLERMGADLRRV